MATKKTKTETYGLGSADLVGLYRTMMTIREFERAAIDYNKKGIVIGNMHMAVGEEAVGAGVMKALQPQDMVTTTHRLDGHLVAKGVDINKMMAELMGRKNGLCQGRAGKMHQCAPEVGVMCGNGIVGAAIPLGAGMALYSQMSNPGQVTVAFVGDGGNNTGAFHEGMNLAGVWKLPAVFVVENNGFAISTAVETATASETIAQRSVSYGMPGVRVDGQDALAVYGAAKEAVDRARRGEGPSLIECVTYRYRGHHEGDEQTYRSKEDVQYWMEHKDPITRMHDLLVAEYKWTEDEDKAVVAEVAAAIEAAVAYGMSGEELTADDIYQYVYVDEEVQA